MIDEQKLPGESPADTIDAPPKRISVNSLTIFLALAFLLILLAESVAASSLGRGTDGPLAINYTKEFKTCIALGKSEEKCNKTATAWFVKTPTPKDCYPYKAGRPVEAGETFDQYISYYFMTSAQRDEFIKINNLSPAYPKTIIYVGVKYCLPYDVNKKTADEAHDVTSFNTTADFGWQVTGINGWEITFDLINFERYDKVNVYFWKKPPGASYWRCRTGSDESCTDVMYREKEVFSDGYAEDRKIWLGQFKVTKKSLTLTFPQEVTGWNQVYVCMHSLFRDEAESSEDQGEYYATYHNYCQLINLDRKVTTRIVREPAPTTTWNFPTATLANTPCGYVYNSFCRPVNGGFWDTTNGPILCGAINVYESDPPYICQGPCDGTRIPTATNTACPALYPAWAYCPGTRVPHPQIYPVGTACTPECIDTTLGGYHSDPVFTPSWNLTLFPTVTPCNQWWVTPASSR